MRCIAVMQVLPGDIVVLGSDGLFDNVSDGEVVTIAEQLLRENCCTPSELARCLLHNAYHNSLDRTKATPYSMAATEVFDMVYSGGKKDDISVVVAKVRVLSVCHVCITPTRCSWMRSLRCQPQRPPRPCQRACGCALSASDAGPCSQDVMVDVLT